MTAAQRRKRNREHGRKSRGPISEAGKEVSRKNALKHGLTAQVVALPNEDPEAIRAETEQFFETHQPRNSTEAALVKQIARASRRLERVAEAETAILASQVRRSQPQWDLAQRLKLIKLRRLLANDPAVAIPKLWAFGAGVSWLLSQWKDLEESFNRTQGWTSPTQIREALRIRGLFHGGAGAESRSRFEFVVLAVSCVDEERLSPQLKSFLASETPGGLHSSGIPHVHMPPEARRLMRMRIEQEIADLKELDRHFREADACSRAESRFRALIPADTPQNGLLLRYMKSAETTLERSLKTLAELQETRQKAQENAEDDGTTSPPNVELRNEPKATEVRAAQTICRQRVATLEKLRAAFRRFRHLRE